MSRAFENDPRLKHMDPGKLSALQSLAKELEAAPGDQKMAAFLSASQKAAREHVSFSAEEQELLIQSIDQDTRIMIAGEVEDLEGM